jgi:hypothetical protein
VQPPPPPPQPAAAAAAARRKRATQTSILDGYVRKELERQRAARGGA